MKTSEIFTAFQAVATGLAALGTVAVAYMGLSTWRRQLAGQASYELARRILRNIYVYRDTIHSVNQAWTSAFHNISLEDFCRRIALPKVPDVAERLTLLKTLEAELEADIVEARVLWGIDLLEMKHLSGYGYLANSDSWFFNHMLSTSAEDWPKSESVFTSIWNRAQNPDRGKSRGIVEDSVKTIEEQVAIYLRTPTTKERLARFRKARREKKKAAGATSKTVIWARRKEAE